MFLIRRVATNHSSDDVTRVPEMPTPSEDTLQPSAPVDPIASPPSGFTSCPPEDIREHHAPREERVERSSPSHPSETAENGRETPDDGNARVMSESISPERDEETGARTTTTSNTADPKAEHVEDAGLLAEPPSPTVGSPDAPSDNDARLAQSMSTAAISSESPSPQYLHFPELDKDRVGLPCDRDLPQQG